MATGLLSGVHRPWKMDLQTTQTDDTNLLSWPSPVSDHRRVDRQTTTQPVDQDEHFVCTQDSSHGSRILRLELLGNVEDEFLLSSDMGRVTTLVFLAVTPLSISVAYSSGI